MCNVERKEHRRHRTMYLTCMVCSCDRSTSYICEKHRCIHCTRSGSCTYAAIANALCLLGLHAERLSNFVDTCPARGSKLEYAIQQFNHFQHDNTQHDYTFQPVLNTYTDRRGCKKTCTTYPDVNVIIRHVLDGNLVLIELSGINIHDQTSTYYTRGRYHHASLIVSYKNGDLVCLDSSSLRGDTRIYYLKTTEQSTVRISHGYVIHKRPSSSILPSCQPIH
jgi:hypothetical protein